MVAKVDCQCHIYVPEINSVHFCYAQVDHARKGLDKFGCDRIEDDRYCVQ